MLLQLLWARSISSSPRDLRRLSPAGVLNVGRGSVDMAVRIGKQPGSVYQPPDAVNAKGSPRRLILLVLVRNTTTKTTRPNWGLDFDGCSGVMFPWHDYCGYSTHGPYGSCQCARHHIDSASEISDFSDPPDVFMSASRLSFRRFQKI